MNEALIQIVGYVRSAPENFIAGSYRCVDVIKRSNGYAIEYSIEIRILGIELRDRKLSLGETPLIQNDSFKIEKLGILNLN